MEGRSVLIIGGLSLVALVVILAFFISRGMAPRPQQATTSTTAPASTTIYVQTTVPTAASTSSSTTTVPVQSSPDWQRFNNDLGLFGNVTMISLRYNATSNDQLFSDGSTAVFYKSGGNESFQTYAVVQNFTLPVMVFAIGGSDVACATLPLQVSGLSTSCSAGSFPFPNMVNFMNLNASAYSNVTYDGTAVVSGEACDRFTATLTQAEAARLTGKAISGATASMCINTQYGYPDSMTVRGAGTTSSLALEGASYFVPSAYLHPPSDFSISNATCTPSYIHMTFTPFYNVVNPSFIISGAFLNASRTNVQTEMFNATTSYLTNAYWMQILAEAISNGTNVTNSSIVNPLTEQYNSSYGGYTVLLGSNFTYDLLNYQNSTVEQTIPGSYSAMHSYPVSLPVGMMVPALGFSLCDASGCQTVSTC